MLVTLCQKMALPCEKVLEIDDNSPVVEVAVAPTACQMTIGHKMSRGQDVVSTGIQNYKFIVDLS